MIRHIHSLGKQRVTQVTLALLCLLPASASAETLTFINDTKSPVVVQLAIEVRGAVRRDRPYQIAPGEKAPIMLSGDKLVNIYDARQPNRPLYQGTIPASTEDQTYLIKADPRGLPKFVLERVKQGSKPPPRQP
jgi:hypothetical protein